MATALQEGRTPLLASGSNAAPGRLLKKLGSHHERLQGVVGILARLRDFDCVYSAHITSYGAEPATLWPSPGTLLSVVILLVTKQQLGSIDRTEALGFNYDRAQLRGLRLEVDDPVLGRHRFAQAEAYLSRRGALKLAHPGNPWLRATPLAEIEALRRRAAPLDQRQTLNRLMASLSSHETGCELEWARRHSEPVTRRQRINRALAGQPWPTMLQRPIPAWHR